MNYQELADKGIAGYQVTQPESLSLLRTPDSELFSLLAASHKLRRHFKGNKIKLCSIVNAKSGKCSENCSFCAQSAHFKTNVASYPLMSQEEIFESARPAEAKMSATCFSIVTAGKSIHTEKELASVGAALRSITDKTDLNRCVSMGTLDLGQIQKLKESGLTRLHHNLETAESFFSHVCTTHTYAERLQTIKMAKAAGLEVCSGGIFGLGETNEQRVELAFTLRELNVESVPINILHPIAGTPAAENHQTMTPF